MLLVVIIINTFLIKAWNLEKQQQQQNILIFQTKQNKKSLIYDIIFDLKKSFHARVKKEEEEEETVEEVNKSY